ncbi:MAG: FecR family protein [Bacteroidota bacterium]
MNKELFTRYINNQCTGDELDRLVNWLRDEAGSVDARQLLQPEWTDAKEYDKSLSVDYDRILDTIHRNIDLSRSQKVKPISGSPTIKKQHSYRFISVLSRIAAVLFIPLFLYFMHGILTDDGAFPGEKGKSPELLTEVISPQGSITYMELPDGSKVWLNHGSSLQFPQQFRGKTRTVKLSGEGYFQIAHNEIKPFVVDAGEIQAFVKGTEFDMMAYPGDRVIETTLKSGSLILQRRTGKDHVQDLFHLTPGHHVEYLAEEKKLIYSNGNVEKYISWKDGKLIFENDSFDEIAARLSRWYNVDIQLLDPELSHYTYTATFMDETLVQVLDLLEIATPVKYRISGRKKQQDGTFSKRKVIIQAKTK